MSGSDFFSVGRPKEVRPEIDLEENKNWKDIRPNSGNEALLKNAFKKRKYDEFKEKKAKFAAMPGQPKPSSETGRILPFTNKPMKRFKVSKDEAEKFYKSDLSNQYRQKQQQSKEAQ